LNSFLEKPGWMKDVLDQREKDYLSPLASFSDNGQRRHAERHPDSAYRQSYSIDADRVLNSLAYTRYIDKTQVFSFIKNDHLTHRVLHVQLVSRIARTIGRYLGLNEDLIEAASLGHDLGHPPFGHDGELFLSRLCREHGAGYFHHNWQSIQFLEKIERNGQGWNLTLQTLDAILCHNGEVHSVQLKPSRNKTFDDLDKELINMKNMETQDLVPMTMEGCVVRMADAIAYLGRDMEDAVRLGIIERSQLPVNCSDMLGRTNGTIVFNLVTDLITTSMRKPFIAFSPEGSQALKDLREFNYQYIYKNPVIKEHLHSVEKIYRYLFETFLEDLTKERFSSPVFSRFVNGLSGTYSETHSNPEIVRDFIAGMTDSFFVRQAPDTLRPTYIEMQKTNV